MKTSKETTKVVMEEINILAKLREIGYGNKIDAAYGKVKSKEITEYQYSAFIKELAKLEKLL